MPSALCSQRILATRGTPNPMVYHHSYRSDSYNQTCENDNDTHINTIIQVNNSQEISTYVHVTQDDQFLKHWHCYQSPSSASSALSLQNSCQSLKPKLQHVNTRRLSSKKIRKTWTNYIHFHIITRV